MTFPKTPLPIGLELYVNGAWLDITEDLSDEGMSITRGRSDEGRQVDPAYLRCKLRNHNGKYSPRNPRSSLYGQIGRNTPIRTYVENGQVRLTQNSIIDYFACNDSTALSIAGDIDLRVDVAMRSWRPTAQTWIGLLKPDDYGLAVKPSGVVTLFWCKDGPGTGIYVDSTDAIPGGMVGRKAVRATLDVDNGSGNHVVRFYVSDSVDGTWEQLGQDVFGTGVTSIYNSSQQLTTQADDPCEVFATEVRNGINGTIVAKPIFTSQANNAESFTDAYGNTWSKIGAADVWNRHYRFSGEVTSWPQRWGLKGGQSAYSPIECNGIMRRLGQGASPVKSAMYRGCSSIGPNLVAYWPMEDSAGATNLSPVLGTQPARIIGNVDVATFNGFIASSPIPKMNTGRLYCGVPQYANTGEAQIRWLISVPQSGLPADTVLLRIRANSTLGWVDVLTAASGEWYAKLYTNSGVLSYTTTTLASDMNGRDLRLSVELKQNGGSVDITLVSVESGVDFGFTLSGTKSGLTLGSITAIDFNPERADLGDTAIGHVTIEKAITSIFDLLNQFAAYPGERADARMERLGFENDILISTIGSGGGVERMGPQLQKDLLSLLREAADSDTGVLFEPRGVEPSAAQRLTFRTIESLCSQEPAVVIEYTDNLLLPFEPVDDDQGTRNKVTVTREGGGSYIVEQHTGRMSTLPSPYGVGVYDEEVTLSLNSDAAAKQQAGWRVHIGTTDEARWPQIGLDLAHPVFLADAVLTRQILSVDIGDRIDVTSIPTWLPPDPVQQIVQGYTEDITPFNHKIVFNCTPATPYNIGTYVASGYTSETVTTDVPATTLMSDDGTGKSNGTVLDTSKWVTQGTTANGGTATYQSSKLEFKTGTGATGSDRITRNVNTADRADVDLSGTFVHGAGFSFPIVAARATVSGVDYPDCYALDISTGSTLAIAKVVGYSGSNIGTASKTISAGTTYGFRFRVKGTSLKARVWTGTEPSTWDISITDSTITSAGKSGITIGPGASGANIVTFDNVVVTDAGESTSSTTTVTAIPAGHSHTRFSNDASRLATDLPLGDTSLSVTIPTGPLWTTDDADFPLDIMVSGERMTITEITGTSSPQTFTVERAVNGLSKEHMAGEPITLAEPVFWSARPFGGTAFDGGDGGTGGGGVPDPEIPNTVRIGTATYPLSGQNPGSTGGWGGDTNYPGARGVDQLVTYTNPPVSTTATNQWGTEVTVNSSGVVTAVNDREPTQNLTGTTVPGTGYVLSGHAAARQWLLTHATVGAAVELIYVASTPGGGGTGGGTGGGSVGVPAWVVGAYWQQYQGPTVATITAEAPEYNMQFAAFGLGGGGATITFDPSTFQSQASFIADVAASKAAGCRWLLSIGGGVPTDSQTFLTTEAHAVTAFNSLVPIIDTYGFQGLDYDLENGPGGFNQATLLSLSTKLKNRYGPDFLISMVPRPYEDFYFQIAAAHESAGILDLCMFQFYDYIGTSDTAFLTSWIPSRLDAAKSYGVPYNKMVVGCITYYPEYGSGSNTVAVYKSIVQNMKTSRGIRGAFIWESSLDKLKSWNFAKQMATLA